MRRRFLILLAVAIVVGLTSSVAVSATRINRITFRAVDSIGGIGTLAATTATHSSTGNGRCEGNCVGKFLQVEGQLVELESTEELTIFVETTGAPGVSCINPAGHKPPGQNPPKRSPNVTANGQQQIGVTQVTPEGTADINLTFGLPAYTVPGKQMGCPNNHWTATIDSIRFAKVTVSVFQGETLLLEQTFRF